MKKILCLFLSVLVFVMLLTGCKDNKPNGSEDYDIWDGSVADSFDGGNGTSETPYEIASAAQLAFLAEEINSGKDYKGKYFSLLCNLDLNSLEWTPIGNGTYNFEGIFDGNGHYINNLKITTGSNYDKSYPHTVSYQYVSGLFGSCADCIIKNLCLDNAEVIIQNMLDRQHVYVGVLSGALYINTFVEISNVKISNSNITSNYTKEYHPTSVNIGGASGYIFGQFESNCKIEMIQTDIRVSIENGYGEYNYVGGLVGNLSTMSNCSVGNCASYLYVNIDAENCYNVSNCFGALGETDTQVNRVSLSNIFSKVSIDKLCDYFYAYPAYTANAVIGNARYSKQQDGTIISGYEFKNIFGYVEQIDEATNEKKICIQLYDIPNHAIYSETNCTGCDTLPGNNGFDLMMWDLSDPDNPRLK